MEEYDPNAGWTPAADTAYVWDGWKLLLEIDLRDPNDPNDDFIPWKYTWGLDLAGQNGQVNSLEGAGTIGGLLAMQDMDDPNDPSDPNDATGRFACFYDGNGNVTQLLDLSTWDPNNPEVAIRAHYEYDPYGNVVRQTGSYAATNPWRFSTKQFDDETGFGYWGYRYYSPTLGRWVSRDPIAEVGGMNLYLYVENMPHQLSDFTGLCGETVALRADAAVDLVRIDHRGWPPAYAVPKETRRERIADFVVAFYADTDTSTHPCCRFTETPMIETGATTLYDPFWNVIRGWDTSLNVNASGPTTYNCEDNCNQCATARVTFWIDLTLHIAISKLSLHTMSNVDTVAVRFKLKICTNGHTS